VLRGSDAGSGAPQDRQNRALARFVVEQREQVTSGAAWIRARLASVTEAYWCARSSDNNL
jgi:hypothetical protein